MSTSSPSSPRQPPLPAAGATSKIPRRRPSTQLSSSSAPPSRSPSCPPRASTSPTKSSLHHHHAGHARKTSLSSTLSKTHLAQSPPKMYSFADQADDDDESALSPLQERRRSSTSGSKPRETSEIGHHTPPLSICIPSSSALSPSHPRSSSLRRPSHPMHPSPIPSASPSPFAPHSRRTSAAAASRTPRSSASHPHSHPHPHRPPMAERTWSGTTTQTYTSFDLQPPRSPKEEREEPEYAPSPRRSWLAGWLGWRASEGEENDDDEEEAVGVGRREVAEVGERTALLPSVSSSAPLGPVGNGLTGWRYVASETWCYARHILPPLLIFVVLVLVVSLLAYKDAVRRVVHPPHAT